ncbi:MAG TPA: DUF1232 domain-containing protein [Euzebyales bacterium]|nr:DUF1232 domain-containing protein [Euzebyales bacterium]
MRDWQWVAVIAVGVLVLIVLGIRTLMRGRKVPNKAKLAILGAVVWLLSPLDPLPDVLPAVGVLDDLVVLVAAVRYVLEQLQRSELPDQRLEQHEPIRPTDWRLGDGRRPPELPDRDRSP